MNRLEAAEAGYHSMRDMIVRLDEAAAMPIPAAESQDGLAGKVAEAERTLSANIARLRKTADVPGSFREMTADVDALLARFPPIPDVWVGQDSDPADGPDGDPDGPWVTTGIIVHLAGSTIQLRPDVRTLEDVENVMKIFEKTAGGPLAESHNTAFFDAAKSFIRDEARARGGIHAREEADRIVRAAARLILESSGQPLTESCGAVEFMTISNRESETDRDSAVVDNRSNPGVGVWIPDERALHISMMDKSRDALAEVMRDLRAAGDDLLDENEIRDVGGRFLFDGNVRAGAVRNLDGKIMMEIEFSGVHKGGISRYLESSGMARIAR